MTLSLNRRHRVGNSRIELIYLNNHKNDMTEDIKIIELKFELRSYETKSLHASTSSPQMLHKIIL
jgi:hypothetical protein